MLIFNLRQKLDHVPNLESNPKIGQNPKLGQNLDYVKILNFDQIQI